MKRAIRKSFTHKECMCGEFHLGEILNEAQMFITKIADNNF